jgi:hypothetical protein
MSTIAAATVRTLVLLSAGVRPGHCVVPGPDVKLIAVSHEDLRQRCLPLRNIMTMK